LALNNINLDIKEGEKIGLVGKSGSGKSTIIQLLLGFYHPTAGKILIDGINMTDYNIHHLRANFGVVSQEPILFNQTIEYNIKYNKENATKEDIVAAAN
jgi:ATP-binding cassette subfamily B (MDR/TAP) protein 1